jgi:RNA polymerase sigma-70 factor (ECF subfamily)
MLVDLNDRTGVTLKRSMYCDLEAGLASAPAGPSGLPIAVRAKGATTSLRTQRKSQVGADHRSTASQAVMVPRPSGEQTPNTDVEYKSKPANHSIDTAGAAALVPPLEEAVKIESEDDEIVKRCLAGDRDAFELLVRRHGQRVFNIIASFFRRRDIVEDIAQEVFVKSYVSLSSYTIGRSFEAWLARITVNACYDHLRSERRRGEQFFPQDPDREGDWLDLQMLEAAVGQHASAERQREAADISSRLLSKLAPEDRIVLILMDRDGFSVKDVSEMTGWGPSKVKVRAFRARRSLRAAMKRLMTSAERMQRRVR